MSDAQNKSIADFNTDDEVEKYSYYNAVRGMGVEPFPTMSDDLSSLPTNEVDDYFLKLAEQSREARGAFTEAGKSAVAGVRQPLQEGINTVTDWFGTQLKEFYTVNGFASPEQVENIIPESMLAYANEKGINTELPLKHVQPDTQLGITGRELIAYTTGFLLSMGKGARKEATDTVLDGIGRYSHNLLRAARGNTGGAMSLNVAEANLSDLAVELGFDEELRNYFSDGSIADRVATAVADETNIRANPKLDDASLASLSAEGRLARKLDTVLEENYIGAALGTAILTAAKAFKVAGAKGSAAIGAGAVVATPSDAESNPIGRVTRLAQDVRNEERLAREFSDGGTPLTEDFRVFRDGQEVEIGEPVMRAVDEDELGFYSAAFRAAKNLNMENMTAQQAKRMLEKAGVKKEEMQWSGLNDFLASKGDNGKITKEELVTHLQENRVQLDERTLSNDDIPDGAEDYERQLDEVRDSIYYDHSIDESYEAYSHLDEMYHEEFYGYDERTIDNVLEVMSQTYTYTDEQLSSIRELVMEDGIDGVRKLEQQDDAFRGLEREISDTIEAMAKDDYLEGDPNIEVSFSTEDGTRYNVYGSDGMGYHIMRDGDTIAEYDVYSLNEVAVQIEQDMHDIGAFSYPDDMSDEIQGYARWASQREDGGTNYREMLLINDSYQGDPDYGETMEASKDRFSAFRQSDSGITHYPEENIIYHVRTTDRVAEDGGKVLYIEELQSDWAQRGRKMGFYNPEARNADIVQAELGDIEKQKKILADKVMRDTYPDYEPGGNKYMIDDYAIAEKSKPYAKLMREEKSLEKELNIGRALPRGPFVDSTDKWSTLAVKRLLRYATDNGYDYIAITPGKLQAKRWTNQGLEIFYDRVLVNNINDALEKISKNIAAGDKQMPLFDDMPSMASPTVGRIKIPEMENKNRNSEEVLPRSAQAEYPEIFNDGMRNAIPLSPKIKEEIKKGTSLFTPAPLAVGAASVTAFQSARQKRKQGQNQVTNAPK